jgi:hypothetical protein
MGGDERRGRRVMSKEDVEREKIKKQTEDFKKKGKEKVTKKGKKRATLFSKIPESLVFDNAVSSTAKLLYAVYFKFSRQKDIDTHG